MSKTIKTLTLIALLAALAGCGGDDANATTEEESTAEEVADNTGVDAEDVITDTASDVITTTADINGFRIVTTTFNPRAGDYYGTEVDISAFVKDHSNNPVADGTVVTFVTDDNGLIQDQCVTIDGQCSVKWWSAGDRTQPMDPDAGSDDIYGSEYNDHIITIMARTIGQDSFIDKNANSLFDANETYFTQSEPFLDANDDGDYDSGITDFDEYFDYNENGQFDTDDQFTTFRGDSCSDTALAAGHCAEQLEIWDTVRMINSSGGAGNIAFLDSNCTNNAAPINVSGGPNTYCLLLTDPYGNIPPAGTKIKISTDNASIDISPSEVPNGYAAPGTGFAGDVRIKPDDDTSNTGTLTIEVEWLDGVKTYMYISITG